MNLDLPQIINEACLSGTFYFVNDKPPLSQQVDRSSNIVKVTNNAMTKFIVNSSTAA